MGAAMGRPADNFPLAARRARNTIRGRYGAAINRPMAIDTKILIFASPLRHALLYGRAGLVLW